MSVHNATIWFQDKLDSELLDCWFGRAAELLGMDLSINLGSSVSPNSQETWSNALASFPDWEYTGNVKWNFEGRGKRLKGSITWPIFDRSLISGTVQFQARWKDRRKSNTYSFDDIDVLVGVLYDLAFATRASSLLVEPARLPEDIADERYSRFKEFYPRLTLTNLDWICGLRPSDDQAHLLRNVRKPWMQPFGLSEFEIYLLSPEPFDFRLAEDRIRLKAFEKDCRLI